MSLTIRPAEPMRRAIRRLARAQLRQAADTLNDHQHTLSERVHQMRTSIKKVRSLVALTRPTVGKPAERADRRLRNIAAATSELRDAEMVLHTLDAVAPRVTGSLLTATPQSSKPAMAGTRNRLVTQLRKSERAFEEARCLDVLTAQLYREAHRVRRWVPSATGPWRSGQEIAVNVELPPSEATPPTQPRQPKNSRQRKNAKQRKGARQRKDDRVMVGAALARGYRRARRAMVRAYDQLTGESFHDWRKAVKAHRYQLQFLRRAWPSEAAARLPDLDRLGELLGDEHDLTVLEETVGAEVSGMDHGAADRLRALVHQRRQALRSEARPVGERLFADRARVFRGRLRKAIPRGDETTDGETGRGEPIDQRRRDSATTSRTTTGGAKSRPTRLTAV